MPNFLESPEMLPLPSLQTYSSVSFLLLSCSIYYAFQVSSEPYWKIDELSLINKVNQENVSLSINETNFQNTTFLGSEFFQQFLKNQNETLVLQELFQNQHFARLVNFIYVMLNEPLCVWTLINMSYCLLILFGKVIQKMVFGELRASEQQMLRDKFWNFIFYKFIFVFSVINVQYMDELIMWCAWFSVLGFMFLLVHLCKERFNYLTFSFTISKWDHFRLLTLLISILLSNIPLFMISVVVGIQSNFSVGAFLFCECLLLFLRTLHCLILYLVHLWDLSRESIWEKRTITIYYIELSFDVLILFIDFAHHLHMLFWSNIILSVSSLVILIQLRAIFTEIMRRLRKHQNYIQVLNLMQKNFPIATKEELTDNNNDCAICWDRMETARKLPCNHFFHTTCLRSWLEQDTSCPTCRHSLRRRGEDGEVSSGSDFSNTFPLGGGVGGNNGGGRPVVNTRFFHFDGSRYARWLPSVSVEVSRPNINDIHYNINASLGGIAIRDNEPFIDYAQQQIDYMGQQVLEWFPQFSLTTILDDLRATRSVEHTIENILDARLQPTVSSPNTDNSNREYDEIRRNLFRSPDFNQEEGMFFNELIENNRTDENPINQSPVANNDNINNDGESLLLTRKPEEQTEHQTPTTSQASEILKESNEKFELTNNNFLSMTPDERHQSFLLKKRKMFEKAKIKYLNDLSPNTA